jgi:hypothetical protein
MKTDVKQLLKELSTRGLEFRDPADAKLLNKEKKYHFHDTYLGIDNTNCEYSYPCLVELEIGNSLVFKLKRKNQNLGIKPIVSATPVTVSEVAKPVETKVDTAVVSDEAAKALIGEFLEKNQ